MEGGSEQDDGGGNPNSEKAEYFQQLAASSSDTERMEIARDQRRGNRGKFSTTSGKLRMLGGGLREGMGEEEEKW